MTDSLTEEDQKLVERVLGPAIGAPHYEAVFLTNGQLTRLLEAVRQDERSKGWKPIESADTQSDDECYCDNCRRCRTVGNRPPQAEQSNV